MTSALPQRAHAPRRPLAGTRVLDYSQFVAGPLATMLLADLGADVIKIEPPRGDAYRDYEPLGNKRSRRFFALNRGKRSVTLDLTARADRNQSQALIASADALVHNMPEERARRFGLDPETARQANPRIVISTISAFGTAGSLAASPGYDLIAQAYSGLLFADPRSGQHAPRRCGHIPIADITAGLLTAISVLVGLLGRHNNAEAINTDVSLLGAALLTQVQDLVRLPDDPPPVSATAELLTTRATTREHHEALEPYYGCYRSSDGFVALACLNMDQRRRVGAVLGLTDPWVANPQAPAASEAEYRQRAGLKTTVARLLAEQPSAYWVESFARAKVPCARVNTVEATFIDEQAAANRLTQTVPQPGIGGVQLYGAALRINGEPLPPSTRPAPDLGQHNNELLALPRSTP